MRTLAATRLVSCASVFILISSVCSAGEFEIAKEALLKSDQALSGEGAVVDGPCSIEDVEKKSMEYISQCENCPQVPFAHANDRWKKFVSQYQEGDVILYYHSNDWSWSALCGREGYALIRGETIIDDILTILN